MDYTKTGQIVLKESQQSLVLKDLYNRQVDIVSNTCIAFEYMLKYEYLNEIRTMYIHYNRLNDTTWELHCLTDNDIPIRLIYNVPSPNVDLVLVAQMGLFQIRTMLEEYSDMFQHINYKIWDMTAEEN